MPGAAGPRYSTVMRIPFVPALVLASLLSTATLAAQPALSEEAALEAYRRGEFGRAVQLYQAALTETESAERRAEIHVRIAWTLFALGREGEVQTHLRAALAENPNLVLATDYYTQEFVDLFEAARTTADRQVSGAAGPPQPDVEATLAAIASRLEAGEDLEGALADVDRLLVAFPGDARLAPLKVALLERLGRTEEAAELRSRYGLGGVAAPVASLSIPDLILRANALLGEGDVESSLEMLREVVARQPNNVAGLELMAEAAQRAARWQEAEFALKSALGLQPDNIGLRLRLGEVYLEMGDASAARDVFRQLTERWPHSDRAWASLGLLDARLGRHERALQELDTALAENPLLPEVQLAVGELLLYRGEPEAALEPLRAASNLQPEDPQVAARLGQALLALDRPAEALATLRTGVAGGFAPKDVQRALVLALIQQGVLSEAQRVIDALGDSGDETTALRALLALERGRLEEAESAVRAVLAARPTDPALLGLLSAVLYRQGRHLEAVELLETASELAPSSERLAVSLARARAAARATALAESALVPRPAPER